MAFNAQCTIVCYKCANNVTKVVRKLLSRELSKCHVVSKLANVNLLIIINKLDDDDDDDDDNIHIFIPP